MRRHSQQGGFTAQLHNHSPPCSHPPPKPRAPPPTLSADSLRSPLVPSARHSARPPQPLRPRCCNSPCLSLSRHEQAPSSDGSGAADARGAGSVVSRVRLTAHNQGAQWRVTKPSQNPLPPQSLRLVSLRVLAPLGFFSDENGAFVHGALNIGASGMQVASTALTAAEEEELKLLKKDTRLEDLEVHTATPRSHAEAMAQPAAAAAIRLTRACCKHATRRPRSVRWRQCSPHETHCSLATPLLSLVRQFLEKLGEGNSSVVHRAYDRRLHREYAVKRINIYDRSKRHQIIKELHTLYKCDCPQLISFHGAFFKEGAISIALELMDVGSLADVLAVTKSIPEPELAYLAKPMLEGLAYLRRKHKIHRDIKPSNICINSAAEAKLSDFGITTSVENTLDNACASFVGTSAWMSPERLEGKPYKYPSDIWAIGIVLLEAAQGRFPYEITDVYLEMMQAVINGPSPALPRLSDGSYVNGYSKEFASVIDLCLKKDSEARATAEEILLHPWFKKQAGKRSAEQMREWIKPIKAAIQQRAARERAKAEGGSTSGSTLAAASCSSSTTASATASSGVASSSDPFVAGYNNTTTSGGSGAQGQAGERFNVPQNAQSSFYTAKELK